MLERILLVNSLVLFFERFKLNISFLQNKFCSAMGNKMYPKKKNIRRMGVRKGEEKRRKRMVRIVTVRIENGKN